MLLPDVTTIQVSKDLLKELKSIKEYPRQSYSELLMKVVTTFKKSSRQRTEYDEFLFKIQQERMQALWDNDADERWEHV